MAKPNYSFEKRQREMAKKKKQEEKRLRKLEKTATPSGDTEIENRESEQSSNNRDQST